MPGESEIVKTRTNSPSERSAYELLEKSAKVVLASLAVLYCAGMLITNIALMSLGITDFSSFRAKYIFTGLWPFGFVLLASFPWTMRILWKYSTASRKKIFGETIYAFAVAFGLWLLVLCRYLQVSVVSAVMNAAVLFTLASVNVDAAASTLKTAENSRTKAVVLAASFILAVAFAVWQVDPEVYFKIPQQLGGGKPTSATLALTTEGRVFWKETVNSTYSGEGLSDEVNVYYETDKELVVKTIFKIPGVNCERTLRISKSLVNGILVSPAQERESWSLQILRWLFRLPKPASSP